MDFPRNVSCVQTAGSSWTLKLQDTNGWYNRTLFRLTLEALLRTSWNTNIGQRRHVSAASGDSPHKENFIVSCLVLFPDWGSHVSLKIQWSSLHILCFNCSCSALGWRTRLWESKRFAFVRSLKSLRLNKIVQSTDQVVAVMGKIMGTLRVRRSARKRISIFYLEGDRILDKECYPRQIASMARTLMEAKKSRIASDDSVIEHKKFELLLQLGWYLESRQRIRRLYMDERQREISACNINSFRGGHS